jgi:vitamin B12 transporter
MVPLIALRVLAAAVITVSPSPSPSPLPEIAHVVTSDRSDETLHNAVRTTYVVTAADIERNGYRTVSDALANVPGVEITSDGPIGAAASYGIRGSSSSQVLVLIDGQPAPGGLADSVPVSTISTAGVARIEVVEGGGSTLYGTSAVGGIINIITDGTHAPASATVRYGTFDDREVRVEDDGFSVERIVANNSYALPPDGAGTPATRNDSDYEATTARYGADRQFGALDVAFHGTLESDDLGAIGEFPFFSPTSREHDVNENGTLVLSEQRAQSNASLSFTGSEQQITFGCDMATDAGCFQASQSLSTEVRNGVSLRNVISGANERTIYGIDLSRGIVSVNDGEGDPVAANALAQSAAYVQQSWETSRNEFYAGLRGERDGSLGGEFSPSLGFRTNFSQALSLKVNAASAFRAPNASELYFPNFGNPDLHSERAQVGDATLTDDRVLGGTSLGWFDNYTRDLIITTCVVNCLPTSTATAVFLPENVAHAHIEGLTFDTKTVPLNGVSATLNATDLYLAQDLDEASRLPDDPVFAVNLGLVFHGGVQSLVNEAGISERVVGARGAVDPTQPLFFQPAAYSDLTAYASMRVGPRTLLKLRGYNLGNERYAEVSGFPMPGRTFAIELTGR